MTTVSASYPIHPSDEIVVAMRRATPVDAARGASARTPFAAVTSAFMQPAEDSADELVLAFVAGDATAFERLYDLHERRCFQFVRRMLANRDEAEAEDLHQEVWLAVARSAAQFNPAQARFVTWLFTIARNKVMDHFRRSRGVVHLTGAAESNDAQLAEREWHELSPERIAHDRQLAAAIVREVEALPLAQRETFVLFAHHDLSLAEVAEITGVGAETAKSRLRYARRTLCSKLGDWNPDHG
jgi:RNA polymerase sigma-70 factor (ECF subfamily)